jgi:hypothetical protein
MKKSIARKTPKTLKINKVRTILLGTLEFLRRGVKEKQVFQNVTPYQPFQVPA